ncbi:uncharacterized protein N7482_007172 [Penicillium canariense]|uniref:Uncharacterized protein n=1 Tax=Penicillium canariense TaxID=189055 RepID=A0A9W9HYJ1_9EURO|nr:uncharacterized protein N7482_007172 [Penicillium canariense]KAJ5160168.1 hypothetical protein N7482_007172 [Penicillium canariense]
MDLFTIVLPGKSTSSPLATIIWLGLVYFFYCQDVDSLTVILGHDNLRHVVFTSTCLAFILSMTAVGFRILSRKIDGTGLFIDEFPGLCLDGIAAKTTGAKHQKLWEWGISIAGITLFTSSILYNLCIGSIKLPILILYRSLFPVKPMGIAVKIVSIAVVLWTARRYSGRLLHLHRDQEALTSYSTGGLHGPRQALLWSADFQHGYRCYHFAHAHSHFLGPAGFPRPLFKGLHRKDWMHHVGSTANTTQQEIGSGDGEKRLTWAAGDTTRPTLQSQTTYSKSPVFGSI